MPVREPGGGKVLPAVRSGAGAHVPGLWFRVAGSGEVLPRMRHGHCGRSRGRCAQGGGADESGPHRPLRHCGRASPGDHPVRRHRGLYAAMLGPRSGAGPGHVERLLRGHGQGRGGLWRHGVRPCWRRRDGGVRRAAGAWQRRATRDSCRARHARRGGSARRLRRKGFAFAHRRCQRRGGGCRDPRRRHLQVLRHRRPGQPRGAPGRAGRPRADADLGRAVSHGRRCG